MAKAILILGGTKEAAALAEKLVAEKPDARIISSLAGRTKEPKPLAGETRIGGFGGAEGLARFIQENSITMLIDATHPFARNISKNAEHAAKATGIAFQQIKRPPWEKHATDQWIEVTDIQEAILAIPAGARVLLALGAQHIAPFATRNDVHFIVRMVDEPAEQLPIKELTLLLGKPGDIAHETSILRDNKITHIVCRNSGGDGAYAKIEAARQLCLPVIIIQR